MSELADGIRERIEAREAVIGVVGLGYVGLPIAVAFAEAGFRVAGVDLDKERVRAIDSGRSYLRDVPDERVAELRGCGRLTAGDSFQETTTPDVMLLCLPTPLTEGAPDLSLVIAGVRALTKTVKKGDLVVLESTTYPGTTEEIVRPLLEEGGLTAGRDFLLAFSPERIDPGNPMYEFEDIPKVVGGIDSASTDAAATLYGQVIPKVVCVSGTREAELSKLIENTFRHVNIALVNELAVYAHEMGIDIWESLEAAATKPFGFMPFWPGPGWGGHCIPLDPSYLSWRVRRDFAHEVRFVELAHAVNSEMRRHVVERTGLLLKDFGKSLRDARILGVGVAYKGGTEDTRESPALKVLGHLADLGAVISYHDPLVPQSRVGRAVLTSTELTAEALRQQDLVVLLVRQLNVDWELIAREAPLILDCCNVLGKRGDKVVRL